MDPAGQPVEVRAHLRTPPTEGEPYGAHAAGVEAQDLVVGDGDRRLAHTYAPGPRPTEGIDQGRLVDALEGGRDQGPADNDQLDGGDSIVLQREHVGHVAAVGHQRVPRRDDVEARVEHCGEGASDRVVPLLGFQQVTAPTDGSGVPHRCESWQRSKLRVTRLLPTLGPARSIR